TSHDAAWGSVRTQVLDSGIADLAVPQSVLGLQQPRARKLRAGERSHVAQNDLLGRTVHLDASRVQPDATRAEVFHRRKIMRYEKYGSPAASEPVHSLDAFFLEAGVAHRQHLVDHQDVGVEMRCNRE